MVHHRYRHVPLHHENERRWDPWDAFTSAVGSAFDRNGNNDNDGSGSNANGNGNNGDSPQTIVRTVFTTMTPSGFEGGPLTTVAPKEDPTPTDQPTPQQTDSHSSPKQTGGGGHSLPSAIDATGKTKSIPSTLAVASTKQPKSTQETGAAQSLTGISGAASTNGAAVSASDNSDGGDNNTAAKAGIAIGVLAGIFIIVALVWFIVSKRRRQMERQQLDDDEKINGPFIGASAIPVGGRSPSPTTHMATSTPTANTTTTTSLLAPRLSLRPASQFQPNLVGAGGHQQQQQQHPDRRASRGATIAMNAAAAAAAPLGRPVAGGSAWERPMTSQSTHSANPFGDRAERLHSPTHQDQPVSPISQTSDVGTAMSINNSPPHGSPVAAVAAGAAVGAGVVAAGAAGLARKASTRKEGPKPLDLTLPPPLSAVPPSPAGTEFSVNSMAPGQAPGPSASAAAIAAAGGPTTSTVHRVQLDFKPTMEDEMGLRAGQLVRLLHEYDDGWALCIRLDRSQQGVVPRTCLSTRPVKPRPTQGGPRVGPPVNPQGGPGPRAGPGPQPQYPGHRPHNGPGYQQQGRPQSPAGGRPMSPYDNRPQSPAGQRSQSPGPRQQQGRPQSPNGVSRRMSPPGPSPMNQEYRPAPSPSAGPQSQGPIGRKPVPGQAY